MWHWKNIFVWLATKESRITDEPDLYLKHVFGPNCNYIVMLFRIWNYLLLKYVLDLQATVCPVMLAIFALEGLVQLRLPTTLRDTPVPKVTFVCPVPSSSPSVTWVHTHRVPLWVSNNIEGYPCPEGHFCLSGAVIESKCDVGTYAPSTTLGKF